ncbi:MAG: choice-of-anchor D domain-containing protein [Deltaproteobacteria bacterium]|nr:choice-of-anchor D domain-containing protein [Deltaproteobacteria bacterium]
MAALGCGKSEPLFPRVPAKAVDAGRPFEPPRDAGFDAGPLPECEYDVSPASVAFGVVPLGTSETRKVQVVNYGTVPCSFENLGLLADPDAGFSLDANQPVSFGLDGGNTAFVNVTFTAQSADLPRSRTGSLAFDSPAAQETHQAVPLSATIAVGCQLQITPNPLDFGNVPLNTTLTDVVTLSNTGDAPCSITDVALDPVGSPLFSLPNTQSRSLEAAPGESVTLSVTFAGIDSTEPHLRTSNIFFTLSQPSGLPLMTPTAQTIPVEAFINTACLAGSQWIYTVDSNGTLSTFDPRNLTFTDLGVLSCPDFGTPFSMAVDQSAVAWVEYSSGSIYRVDTSTLACTATSFVVNPNLTNFGMGFMFQPATGDDTLFVAGGSSWPATSSELGVISFPSMTLTPVAPISFFSPELTGTGDGELWGFAPAPATVNNVMTLAKIDPTTGNALVTYTYQDIANNGSWAVKFWGGSLYLFLSNGNRDTAVYQVDRNTGSIATVVANSGREIVGAGVSTCAPIQ